MRSSSLNRREAMASLLALSAAGALAACSGGSGETDSSDTPVIDISFASEGAFYSLEEMALISALADTIMPDTETPGAVAAGVPSVLQTLASDWGNDDYRGYWRGGLDALNTALKQSARRDFVDLNETLRKSELKKYDAKVFKGQASDDFYRDLKATILQAYYMSEAGATQELAYEPVPGDWIACMPLSDQPKTWAR